MPHKDYYKVLGLENTASSAEIKQAYLKLTKLFHPDLYPGDKIIEKRFQEITEAYCVLGDLDSRLKYTMQVTNNLEILKEKSSHRHFSKKKV